MVDFFFFLALRKYTYSDTLWLVICSRTEASAGNKMWYYNKKDTCKINNRPNTAQYKSTDHSSTR